MGHGACRKDEEKVLVELEGAGEREEIRIGSGYAPVPALLAKSCSSSSRPPVLCISSTATPSICTEDAGKSKH